VEAISKIKEGITLAFDSGVAQREEEVKRSEGQKLMPGWNFCTFFILKVRYLYFFTSLTLIPLPGKRRKLIRRNEPS
jgi:hypothetical protein